MTPTSLRTASIAFGWLLTTAILLRAQQPTQLSPDQQRIVDASVRVELETTHVPALSLAIVRNGVLLYAHAYGEAQLAAAAHPARPATSATRFPIGSISKQFTAAAILLLAEQGKLSLDDPVARFLPTLTAARDITLRDLLAHTAGYQDYFTEEYIPAATQRPTTVDAILNTWATRPLDFDPGTEWGYSGTNYVVAARIVELASGVPFFAFLQKNILAPAGITDAVLADDPQPQNSDDATGYIRYALGPPRLAPKTGRNWLFGMAALSMTATDLARWDISLINQTLLHSASYSALESEVRLRDGRPTGYGLGVMLREVTTLRGARLTVLEHPGEISGFRSGNYIVPQVGAALVILTNAEYSDAVQHLARRLQGVLGFATPAAALNTPAQIRRADSTADSPQAIRARAVLEGLAHGEFDRTQLTPDAAATFTPVAIEDIRDSLAALGRLLFVKLDQTQLRGGAHHYALTAQYEFGALDIAEYDTSDGKIQQFFLDASQQ